MKKENIADSFSKLIDSTFIRVDGCLVEKGINSETGELGYLWDGMFCKDLLELKGLRDYAANAIKMSIVNPNGESITIPKNYINKYSQGLSPWVEWKRDQIKKTEQDD